MNSLDSRRMCRELWNFCWTYRFYETKSQRCNVRNSILFSYSVIFNVLSEDLIIDEFGGNSFFGLGELEELYEWIMSMYFNNNNNIIITNINDLTFTNIKTYLFDKYYCLQNC